jgi:Putative peptidase family
MGLPMRLLRASVLLIVTAIHLTAARVDAALPPETIRVTNYRDGDTVRFPVPLLRGELGKDDSIAVENASRTPAYRAEGLVHEGRFKILCELAPGTNRIRLKSKTAEAILVLNYAPQTNPYFVRAIYMTDKSGNTDYQTPRADDPQNCQAKIATAMTLMQTFTAERMHELGFGRQTFNLERDAAGQVKVHVVKGAKDAEEYYKLDDQLWYLRVSGELAKEFPTRMAKNVVIAAYTRFDPKTGKMLGHTALGGGGQGLFGSGDLFTWPDRIETAQAGFMNTTPIDPKAIMSDSIGRHTYWGAASTTIGATLHEMGHAFGLPHTTDRLDIMTRGFDRFNRAFTFVDPPSAANKKSIVFTETDVAAFMPVSAAHLVTSPWFTLDGPAPAGPNKVTVVFRKADETIVATSPQGIRYIGGRKKGDMQLFAAPPPGQPAPTEFATPIEPFRTKLGDGGTLVVIDGVGHRREVRMSELAAGKEE